MENNIKSEFKSFINVLSTEICKEVLIDDIKSINTSFNITADKYEKLIEDYDKNLNSMGKQLKSITSTTDTLNRFIDTSNKNTEKLELTLKELSSNNMTMIERVITDNDKIFNGYVRKIKNLNEDEKEKLIYEFKKAIDIESKKYICDLKNEFKNIDVIKVVDDLHEIDFKVKGIEERICDNALNKFELVKGHIEQGINYIDKNNKKISLKMEGKIEEKYKLLDEDVNDVLDYMEKLDVNLNEKIIKTNNLIESSMKNINFKLDKIDRQFGNVIGMNKNINDLNKKINELQEENKSIKDIYKKSMIIIGLLIFIFGLRVGL